MKRFYLYMALFFAMSLSYAQQNVSLRINHMLGGQPFQFNTAAANNVGGDLKFDRLEYYISEITIIHDGGQQTMVPDTWVLANANAACLTALGSFAVTALEGVSFGIGVQSAYNHLDPTTYPPNHPLGLQSPSMQWGWSGGYMFISISGNAGSGFSASYEVQTLGDADYFHTTINTVGTMVGQDLIIDLNADYLMSVKNMNLSTGPSVHGSSGIALTLAQNFRDFVFTPVVATGINPASVQKLFTIAPNPSNGQTRLFLDPSIAGESVFVLYDYTGRALKKITPVAGVANVELSAAGCYLVALQTAGQTVATKRLVIAQ